MPNEKVSRARASSKSDQLPSSITRLTIEEAQRLAHNLKAPVTALKYLLNRQAKMDIPPEQKKLFVLAVDRLTSISAQFLPGRAAGSTVREIDLSYLKCLIQETLVESGAIQELAKARRTPEIVFYNFTKVQKVIYSPSRTTVRIDPVEMKSILFAIFENSYQAFATETEKPIIKISCFIAQKMLILEIQDNGKGIKKAHLARIGKKYSTLDKLNGNGVGVFFAKQTIEKWGGKFTINSKFNFGTTTLISLPVQQIELH